MRFHPDRFRRQGAHNWSIAPSRDNRKLFRLTEARRQDRGQDSTDQVDGREGWQDVDRTYEETGAHEAGRGTGPGSLAAALVGDDQEWVGGRRPHHGCCSVGYRDEGLLPGSGADLGLHSKLAPVQRYTRCAGYPV